MSLVVTLSANTSWYLYNFRKNTIISLIENGYKVVCICPNDSYSEKLLSLGCDIQEININSSGSNPFSDMKLIFNILLIYKRLNPLAVFHFTIKNNVYGTIAASLLGIKSINNISGLGSSFIHNNFKSNVAKFLYKKVLPFSYIVHVQNEDDKKLLEAIIPSIKKSIRLIPGSGVDVNRFSPDLKESKSSNSQIFKFLFAGRFISDKGLYEIIDSITVINSNEIKCEFWLIGFQDKSNISSINPSVINQWKSVPGLKIFEPTDELEKFLAQVDCFVLPSYREGMPKSILEACSMSLPVICSNVPGCRNIVSENFNGFLCEPKNSDSLRLAMEKMMHTTSENRKILGKNGRERVLKYFDEKILIKEAISIVNDLASIAPHLNNIENKK
ncbi:glycosyltransferase family 4 protein [Gammaproteobacteria bacterium]|nr:glycosyltransferase family 4 protein [Gammaproteobacteria bacterium]